MRKMFVLIVLVWSLMATTVNTLTTTEAQECANRLLNAYNSRVYPAKMLAIEAIASRVFGRLYRSMSAIEKAEAIKATKQVLRESFEDQTGQYQYKDLKIVESVEITNHGFRINGSVHISSPKYVGQASFLALVYPGCMIEQARIGDIYALDSSLREILRRQRRWKDLLR